MAYCEFGNLKFALPDTGIESIEDEIGQDVATYDLATGKPRVDAVGEKLRKLTLKVSLRNSAADMGVAFKTDIKAFITEVEKMVQSIEAYGLMLESGVYQGEYLLTNVKSSILRTLPNGTITEYDATLELTEQLRRENNWQDTLIRKRSKKESVQNWDSVKIVEYREKKQYTDLMMSVHFVNPLYAAYQYGQRVLL